MPKKDLPYSPIGLDLFAVEEKFMARYAISNERKRQGNGPLARVEFALKFLKNARPNPRQPVRACVLTPNMPMACAEVSQEQAV